MLFNIFTLGASILVASATASEFFCGVNTKGGCCAQFFTNTFDQYASGVGCEFAISIIPSTSTVGDTEWSCNDGLNPGCCSLDGVDRPPSPWWCDLRLHAKDGSIPMSPTASSSTTRSSSTTSSKISTSTTISTTKKCTSTRRW
ncbi:hypothetical protein ONS95_002745 [Cadophora gregata]|uniref:uncharacterized protein n=1 Tax=Cadophora gregata TaxID=51156 RepID=UPI0026DBF7BB|nr:uncharacterized protein ONS95_002745 [Cadophora gregata]KAK0110089.1 hypothetical protein ONS95_002745 [Cadophora gregata]KAK0110292.1 hypothetical protein ONS96_001911 [Cadophora gregata f. sp. sojae]